MRSFFKELPYRNGKLLDLAEHSPICCICGEPNDGTVVACHSNSLSDGKGLGTKASDIVAYGCASCHSKIDGRTDKTLTREQRELLFYRGVYNTWLLLMRNDWMRLA